MNLIYWGGYIVLMLVGTMLARQGVIAVVSPTIFLLALMWIWNGLFSYLDKNPIFKLRPLRFTRSFGSMLLLMGVLWLVASMTPLSQQGMFMFGISAPFVLFIAIAKMRFKE